MYESSYSSLLKTNLGTSMSNSTEYSLECDVPIATLHDAFLNPIMRLHIMEQR